MRPFPLGFALGTFSTNCTEQKGGCLYIYIYGRNGKKSLLFNHTCQLCLVLEQMGWCNFKSYRFEKVP